MNETLEQLTNELRNQLAIYTDLKIRIIVANFGISLLEKFYCTKDPTEKKKIEWKIMYSLEDCLVSTAVRTYNVTKQTDQLLSDLPHIFKPPFYYNNWYIGDLNYKKIFERIFESIKRRRDHLYFRADHIFYALGEIAEKRNSLEEAFEFYFEAYSQKALEVAKKIDAINSEKSENDKRIAEIINKGRGSYLFGLRYLKYGSLFTYDELKEILRSWSLQSFEPVSKNLKGLQPPELESLLNDASLYEISRTIVREASKPSEGHLQRVAELCKICCGNPV